MHLRLTTYTWLGRNVHVFFWITHGVWVILYAFQLIFCDQFHSPPVRDSFKAGNAMTTQELNSTEKITYKLDIRRNKSLCLRPWLMFHISESSIKKTIVDRSYASTDECGVKEPIRLVEGNTMNPLQTTSSNDFQNWSSNAWKQCFKFTN